MVIVDLSWLGFHELVELAQKFLLHEAKHSATSCGVRLALVALGAGREHASERFGVAALGADAVTAKGYHVIGDRRVHIAEHFISAAMLLKHGVDDGTLGRAGMADCLAKGVQELAQLAILYVEQRVQRLADLESGDLLAESLDSRVERRDVPAVSHDGEEVRDTHAVKRAQDRRGDPVGRFLRKRNRAGEGLVVPAHADGNRGKLEDVALTPDESREVLGDERVGVQRHARTVLFLRTPAPDRETATVRRLVASDGRAYFSPTHASGNGCITQVTQGASPFSVLRLQSEQGDQLHSKQFYSNTKLADCQGGIQLTLQVDIVTYWG